MSIQDELRKLVRELRSRPISIKDIVPLLTQAADRIDELENKQENKDDDK